MAIDFDALKRELNEYMGRTPDETFYAFPDNGASYCLSCVLNDPGLLRGCINPEKLLGKTIRLLEEEMREKAEITAILKKHAAYHSEEE